MRRQSGDDGRNALSERIWKLAREAQQPLQFVSFCRGRSLYLVSDALVSDVIVSDVISAIFFSCVQNASVNWFNFVVTKSRSRVQ